MQRLVILLATGFYAGYIPLAPGTFGSLLALPLLYLLARLSPSCWWCAGVLVLLIIAAACWLAGRAEQILHEQDSSMIVVDEVVGMMVAGLMFPFSWKTVALCFLLFRFFDIAKPPPVGWLDREVKGGTGVVVDDLAAGLYANLLARLLL